MNKTSLLLVAGLALSASAANYGMAGCGLGSIWMGTKHQVSAATTNSSTGTQLFGITTGTSNCADDGVAMDNSETRSFAEANFDVIRQEMAQGQGENLQVLASLMGCDQASFGSTVRAEYGSIFDRADVTSDLMLDRLEATSSCTAH